MWSRNTERQLLAGCTRWFRRHQPERKLLFTWADGQIDTAALLVAVWAAAQVCFIRAGIANEVAKSQE